VDRTPRNKRGKPRILRDKPRILRDKPRILRDKQQRPAFWAGAAQP